MSRDSASQVLSGLLAGDVALIDEAQHLITEDHFTDPTQRSLYRLILSYRSISNGVLSTEVVKQFMSKSDAGTAAIMIETFDALSLHPVTADVTRWQIQQLREERERQLTLVAFREASDILNGSITEEPDRYGRPGRVWEGAKAAREWASARILEINAETASFDAPAADVLREGRDVVSDYLKAQAEDKSRRPNTGLPTFDDNVQGLGKGELVTIAASSGLGKSQWCVHLAYHASQVQGLHVYFATSETVRTTVRSRLVARHSRHDKFAELREHYNLPMGLDSQRISRGTFEDENHIQFLAQVAVDWGALGSSDSSGSCFVAQMPYGQSMSGLAAQIENRSRVIRPDLVIIDYLALMTSDRRYDSLRSDLSATVKAAAHFAVDFNDGEGVPVVTPWQLNRESQKEMTRTGELDQNGLAETSEAVNSSDLVLALTEDGTRSDRLGGLKLHVLKHREGVVLRGDRAIPLSVDYAASWFEERLAAGGADAFDSLNGGLTDAAVGGLFGGSL